MQLISFILPQGTELMCRFLLNSSKRLLFYLFNFTRLMIFRMLNAYIGCKERIVKNIWQMICEDYIYFSKKNEKGVDTTGRIRYIYKCAVWKRKRQTRSEPRNFYSLKAEKK